MSGLRLDIGCGGRGTRWPDFTGVDRYPDPPKEPVADYVHLDFVHDELPWEPCSADEIIVLHCIEHVVRTDGLTLLRRCNALLKPGAPITVSCPDLRRLCERYLAGDAEFWALKYRTGKEVWPGETLADRLNWAIHQEGHTWAYDQESLIVLATEAGLADVKPMERGSRYNTRGDLEVGITATKGRDVCESFLQAA